MNGKSTSARMKAMEATIAISFSISTTKATLKSMVFVQMKVSRKYAMSIHMTI